MPIELEAPEAAVAVRQRIEARYRDRTPTSAALQQRADQSMPGGSTRAGTYHRPYPVFMAGGEGFTLTDVDGHEYLDLLGNYTSLVHGHAHPEVTKAIAEQAAKGTVHGAPVELQATLAEAIHKRISSMARLRFTNSGSEAVMCAIRTARAATGKSKVLKMEGGYHGSYDAAEISIDPGPASRGSAGIPDGPGLSPGMVGEVLITPFNDLDRAAELIEAHRAELAVVIVEPVMNATGMIPADKDFLLGLERATRQAGALLILDEVVTLRFAPGGLQERYRVNPDLTTLGKLIGGGLPIGAFGGRADLMAIYDLEHPNRIFHSGTFNGNAATMAAGLATIELLTPAAIDRLNARGDVLARGLQDALAARSIPGCVTGFGSVRHVHFTDREIRNYRDAAAARRWIHPLLHLALLNHGVFMAPRGMFALSTPMGDREIAATITAFGAALDDLADLPLAR